MVEGFREDAHVFEILRHGPFNVRTRQIVHTGQENRAVAKNDTVVARTVAEAKFIGKLVRLVVAVRHADERHPDIVEWNRRTVCVAAQVHVAESTRIRHHNAVAEEVPLLRPREDGWYDPPKTEVERLLVGDQFVVLARDDGENLLPRLVQDAEMAGQLGHLPSLPPEKERHLADGEECRLRQPKMGIQWMFALSNFKIRNHAAPVSGLHSPALVQPTKRFL